MMLRRYIHCLLALTICLSVFTACSDVLMLPQEDVSRQAGNDSTSVYVSVSVNVPSNSPVTRAGSDYVDDYVYEYKVNDAFLCLFKSTVDNPTTEQMLFHSIYRLNGTEATATGKNFTNTYGSRAVEVKDAWLKDKEHLYAYVICNFAGPDDNPNILPYGNKMFIMRNHVKGGPIKVDGNMNFQKFSRIVFTNQGGKGNFVMTNAPMSDTKRGGDLTKAKIVYLPEITKNHIKLDAEAAEEAPVSIFVERMVCKVTVDATSGFNGSLERSKTAVYYDKDQVFWGVDNRGISCYNVRQLNEATGSEGYLGYTAGSSGTERFVDDVPVDGSNDDGKGLYRVFWAEDVNYHYANRNKERNAAEDKDHKGQPVGEGLQDGPNIGEMVGHNAPNWKFDNRIGMTDEQLSFNYWAENTIDAEGLTQAYTTRVYFKVPFIVGRTTESVDVKGESFFTIPSEDPDKIYHIDGTRVQASQQNKLSDKVFELLKDYEPYQAWKSEAGLGGENDRDLICLTILTEDAYAKSYKKTGDTYDKDAYGNYIVDGIYEMEVPAYTNKNGTSVPYQGWHRLVKVEGLTGEESDGWVEYPNPDGTVSKWCVVGKTGVYDINQDGIYGEVEAINYTSYGNVSFIIRYNPDKVTETAAQSKFVNLRLADNCITKELGKVNYYPFGQAFYKVLVRHFPDEEVDKPAEGAIDYEEVYPGTDEKERARKYLGRYGMVRNTWYNITLTGIRHIGAPADISKEIAKDPGPNAPLPDDETDIIGAKVYIMNWRNRNQDEWLE